jgi:hypothetical protein
MAYSETTGQSTSSIAQSWRSLAAHADWRCETCAEDGVDGVHLRPAHPGEVLKHQFLEPSGNAKRRLRRR